MPLTVKITSESKEKGTFHASGVVTNPGGSEKGKANVLVKAGEKGPQLVVSEVAKTKILSNVVTEYKRFEGPTTEQVPTLAKDVELTFTNLQFAI
ncbi:hypothetical protein [Hymenobacter sp. BT491]|uniref:hypothetical protein n=1 Tax=Hymenobacter sp. BT491 TaxID=2766779 RepID=UPI001653D99E|nr:hypothetical protein [Hymenobacter sp. BT491]MBC6988560.1 hypothetical protein [Hymenobacter sp. BT491]